MAGFVIGLGAFVEPNVYECHKNSLSMYNLAYLQVFSFKRLNGEAAEQIKCRKRTEDLVLGKGEVEEDRCRTQVRPLN